MRVIIITGASGGLAQEMVKQLEKDQLILLGRSRKKLEDLYGQRSNCDLYEIDVTNEQALRTLLQQIDQKYKKVDVLVNNAGYGRFDGFDRFSAQETRDMFEVNTFALMNLSRFCAEKMKKDQAGHIVNIVSMAGLIASAKSSLYSASKFAAIGFSNALRLELAPYHVRVTTVNPGPIRTAFFEQADPEGHYLTAVEKYVLEPEVVARKIIACFGKNKRELNLPFRLNMAHKLYTLFPKIADKLAGSLFNYK